MTADQAQQIPAKQPYNGMWISSGIGAYIVVDREGKSVFVSRSLEACHNFIDNIAISMDRGGSPNAFIVGSCIPDSSPTSDKYEEVSKELPAMSTSPPTRIEAFRTSDGELFTCLEEARAHEADHYIDTRFQPVYNDLVRDWLGTAISPTKLLAWMQRNAKEIQVIATMMMENWRTK